MGYGKMDKEVIEKVYEAMVKIGKPIKPADLIKETGLDKATINKAIKELKLKGRIHSPKRCYYLAN